MKTNDGLKMRGIAATRRFLERRGYDILAEEFKVKGGRADLIARDDDTLVLVEVKIRSGAEKGLPEENNTEAKQRRFEAAALAFIQDYEDKSEYSVRFDVVSILVIAPDRALIKHHINAFSAA